MTVVKFTMDDSKRAVSLHVNGHAGANTYGSDIVCASASILAYTLAQNVMIEQQRGILKHKPTIKLKEGDAIITCRGKDEDTYAELLSIYLVIQTGYQLLAHNYPQNVALEMFGEAETA